MFAVAYIRDVRALLTAQLGRMCMRGRRPRQPPARLRNHLKQHRARLDLTQEDLGARVGVRRQTILAIEKGHYVPSALLAFLLAREMGMRVDELFELEEAREDVS
jgi:putative transcriptional regulator